MKSSPKQLLLITLAALASQGTTAQQLLYTATLEHTLVTEQSITTAGEIGTSALFTPEGDFTLDLNMLMHDTHQGAVEVRAANGGYKGFTASITSNSITFGIGNPEGTITTYPLSKDDKAHTYRTALQGETIHFYADTCLLGTHTAEKFDRQIVNPFTETDDKEKQTGIYSEYNIIRNPGFETEDIVLKSDASDYRFWPAEWEIVNAENKEKQQTGVRCNKNNATYANSREGSSALMFRQDGSGGFTASTAFAFFSFFIFFSPCVCPPALNFRYTR